MLEILDEILNAEREAEEMVAAARKRAAELKRNAEAQLNQELNDAREAARERFQERVAQAHKEAERRKSSELAGLENDAETFMSEHADSVDQAVRRVVEILTTPEFRQE